MIKILKYSFFDLTRSRWIYLYFAFYLILTLALFWLSTNLANVILSLMNLNSLSLLRTNSVQSKKISLWLWVFVLT